MPTTSCRAPDVNEEIVTFSAQEPECASDVRAKRDLFLPYPPCFQQSSAEAFPAFSSEEFWTTVLALAVVSPSEETVSATTPARMVRTKIFRTEASGGVGWSSWAP